MFRRPILAIPIMAAVSLMVPVASHAQFSESFNFLKAVRDRDGDKVTKTINQPGSVIVDTRDAGSGEAAVHIVTRGRDAVWLNFLLSRGAKTDTRDNTGTTALLIASQLRWGEGAEALLKRGANVNLGNSSGETPLIRAVQNRDLPMVRILLTGGADANKPDTSSGLSARDYAARDTRSAAILKAITEARPAVRREIAGPR